MNMTNISKHPCSNKCSNFKEEPCRHCLISSYPEMQENSDFVVGGTVVFKYNFMPHKLMVIDAVLDDGKYISVGDYRQCVFLAKDLRHATTVELRAKRRLNKTVEVNDIGEVQYIENHISPNCKIVSNDESIFYSRALTAQKEVS